MASENGFVELKTKPQVSFWGDQHRNSKVYAKICATIYGSGHELPFPEEVSEPREYWPWYLRGLLTVLKTERTQFVTPGFRTFLGVSNSLSFLFLSQHVQVVFRLPVFFCDSAGSVGHCFASLEIEISTYYILFKCIFLWNVSRAWARVTPPVGVDVSPEVEVRAEDSLGTEARPKPLSIRSDTAKTRSV